MKVITQEQEAMIADQKKLTAEIAAVLSVINGFEYAPESSVYMALGYDLPHYYALRGIMEQAGMVVTQCNTIMLTSSGKQLADKIDAALKEAGK